MCIRDSGQTGRRPPRSTQSRSSAASDVYKRQARIDAERPDLWKVYHIIATDHSLQSLLWCKTKSPSKPFVALLVADIYHLLLIVFSLLAGWVLMLVFKTTQLKCLLTATVLALSLYSLLIVCWIFFHWWQACHNWPHKLPLLGYDAMCYHHTWVKRRTTLFDSLVSAVGMPQEVSTTAGVSSSHTKRRHQ